MDYHTLCHQRDSLGGGNLCGYYNVPAKGYGGGYVHPFCCPVVVALGGATSDAQVHARSGGGQDVAAHGRGYDCHYTAYICPDNGLWQVLVRGDADGDKHTECLARSAGTSLLQEAHHVCQRVVPWSVAYPVLANGNGADLRPDDNGGGCAADIFPPKGSDIFVGLGMLHTGRCVPVADNV